MVRSDDFKLGENIQSGGILFLGQVGSCVYG